MQQFVSSSRHPSVFRRPCPNSHQQTIVLHPFFEKEPIQIEGNCVMSLNSQIHNIPPIESKTPSVTSSRRGNASITLRTSQRTALLVRPFEMAGSTAMDFPFLAFRQPRRRNSRWHALMHVDFALIRMIQQLTHSHQSHHKAQLALMAAAPTIPRTSENSTSIVRKCGRARLTVRNSES